MLHFNVLAKRVSPRWILEGDIRGCFDNFSHSWFLQHIPMDKAVLRKWLEAGYIDEGTLFESRAGTPQGGIIILSGIEVMHMIRKGQMKNDGDDRTAAAQFYSLVT